jgi:hypothetical protein
MPRACSRPATVLALAVGLAAGAGATATAATLITGADVRNGSLTGADVRDRSLRGTDLRAGTIPANRLIRAARAGLRGATGPAGPAGATGPAGPAGPPATSTVVTRSGTVSFTGGDGQIGQTKEATVHCQAGESFVSGGFFAPTATVAGDPNFVVTGSTPVVGDGDVAATTGQTPTGWKITVVRNDDAIGLVTAYALCARQG